MTLKIYAVAVILTVYVVVWLPAGVDALVKIPNHCLRKRVLCPRRICPNGFVRDPSGCQTCLCNPCLTVPCFNTCSNGYVYWRGCRTCACKPTPTLRPTCRPVLCRLKCPNGYLRDSRGCSICRCKSISCRPCITFDICPGNHLFRGGCDTCRCKGLVPEIRDENVKK